MEDDFFFLLLLSIQMKLLINSIERRWLEEESGVVFSFLLAFLYRRHWCLSIKYPSLDFWNTWKPTPNTRSLAHTNNLRFDFLWRRDRTFSFPYPPHYAALSCPPARRLTRWSQSPLLAGRPLYLDTFIFIPLCRWYRQLSWPYTLSSILSDTINLDDYVSNFVALVTPSSN